MSQTCQVDGCASAVKSRGWCMNHYMQYWRRGFRSCGEDGCSLPLGKASDFCVHHRLTVCSFDDCDRPLVAKGLCKMHWRQQRDPNRLCEVCGNGYTGDPRSRYCSKSCKALGMKSPVRVAVESGDPEVILSAVRAAVVVSESGCWIWQFAKNGPGYGVIGHGGSGGMVHRHVMAAALGRPVGSEVVHHKCNVPSCVNPDHLQLTTHRENMAEMFTRTSLERRVMELEVALAELEPTHPLLNV